MFMDDVRCGCEKGEFDNGVCCFALEKRVCDEKLKWIKLERKVQFLVRRNDDGKVATE